MAVLKVKDTMVLALVFRVTLTLKYRLLNFHFSGFEVVSMNF